MKISYGLPYKGSKRKLALKILQKMPPRENFVDLFCGGCAVSHAALLGSRFRHVYINDINPMCPRLFVDALMGKYNNECRWISREEFNRLKTTDPYVAFVWSFGNNLRDYLYSREVEPLKRAMHYAIFFHDYEPAREFGLDLSFCSTIADVHRRYLAVKHYVAKWLHVGRDSELASLERASLIGDMGGYIQFTALHVPQNTSTDCNIGNDTGLLYNYTVHSVSSLGGQIHASSVDYRAFRIPPNSVVYCDIPYMGTDDYQAERLNRFDYASFYEWCREQTEPVFVSSYSMPYEEFACVAEFPHVSSLSAKRTNRVTERLFVPIHQKEQVPVIEDLWPIRDLE